MESPNELQENLTKEGMGFFFQWSRKARDKGFGMESCRVSLGHERGLKILLENDAKMLSHKF
jgi:hypothetical protein